MNYDILQTSYWQGQIERVTALRDKIAAIMTTRSWIAGTSNGRCCPPGFGMNTLRTGSG
jgi:hypothetical protein